MTDNPAPTTTTTTVITTTTPAVAGAHEVKESLHGFVIYPGHTPRRNTPEYNATHHLMCIEQDTPCFICGVQHSTLGDVKKNYKRSKFLESHHFLIQDSLADSVSVDIIKRRVADTTDQQPMSKMIREHMAGIHDHKSLMEFVDSSSNMLILCDKCHLGIGGIHTTSWNYFLIAAFAVPGWHYFDPNGSPADVAKLISYDEHLQELEAAREAAEVEVIEVVQTTT